MNKEKLKTWWKENWPWVVSLTGIIAIETAIITISCQKEKINRLKKQNSRSQLAALHKHSDKTEDYETLDCLDKIYDFAESIISSYPEHTQEEVKRTMGM